MVEKHRHRSKRKKPWLLSGIVSWWKRRRSFYCAHENMQDANAASPRSGVSWKGEKVVGEDMPPFNLASSPSRPCYSTPSRPKTPDQSAGPAPVSKEGVIDYFDGLPASMQGQLVTPPKPHSFVRVKTVDDFVSSTPTQMAKVVTPTKSYDFVRSRTADSFQGSLESMDSLVESYWDPDDDECTESQVTPIATNRIHTLDFLNEHVEFMTDKTQARQVEVVWGSSPKRQRDSPFF